MRPTTDQFRMHAALAIRFVVLPLASVAGWSYGLYYSLNHRNWLMVIIDFVLPPVGIVHGWGAIFGFW